MSMCIVYTLHVPETLLQSLRRLSLQPQNKLKSPRLSRGSKGGDEVGGMIPENRVLTERILNS